MGVKLDHVGKDKGIWVRNGVENEAGIGQWRVEASAVDDEMGRPEVVVVQVGVNDFCMELFQMIYTV